ncbi:hypothetical protein F-S17_0131 [Faustovirus]|nr:hypothetical protein F-LCD7_0146 [Faustovirus]QJX71909.1 hypothetical protein F-M6_0146 [Faustovirus]QJX72397.1 hypothetical protein F-S17_0131 [Faustovirus]QJX73922.1 hypothetical protein F-E9_149 [Faustovirus]SMH63307.1 Hypothetical protein FSTVLC9_272 [Faustovirus]
MYNTTNMEISLIERIIYELTTISSIPKGGKISTQDEYINIITDTNTITNLTRTITGDSRKRTLSVVSSIITTAIELTDWIMRSKYLDPIYEIGVRFSEGITEDEKRKSIDVIRLERDRVFSILRKLYTAINNSIGGLTNLSITYAGDSTTIAHIKHLVEITTSQVSKIVKFAPNLAKNIV